jgi:hydrogenase nickel incorporation protein HypB
VTEGHDKPFKYPAIFARAAVTVLTKVDLLPYLDFDLEQAQEQILSLNPEAEVLLVSVKTGQGVSDWCDLLRRRMTQLRSRRALVEVP